MKVRVVKVGKPAYEAYESLAEMFLDRLKAFVKCEGVLVRASHGLEKTEKNLLAALPLEDHAGRLRKQPEHALICLDERGVMWTSPALAQQLETWQNDRGLKSITFLIGGPYGISEPIRQAADHVWCLSKGVLPSDLAWVVALEQIYRGYTLLKGLPYHHE